MTAILLILLGCGGSDAIDSGAEGPTTSTGAGATSGTGTTAAPTGDGSLVSFTVYTDADCTQLPPQDSVVQLDTSVACNETPDSSISELRCFADRITYMNHPNTSDCSADGIPNELLVGVCQEFPGPVPTWKLIEADSYDCLTK